MMKRSAQGGGSGGGLGRAAGRSGRWGCGRVPSTWRPHTAPGGGLEDMLGGLLGGGASSKAGGGMPGGLGGLLEQLGGSGGAERRSRRSAGRSGWCCGRWRSAWWAASRTVQKRPERNDRAFGAVLNSQFDANPEPEIEPSQDQEAAAASDAGCDDPGRQIRRHI